MPAEARRLSMLQAMGIEVYRLRAVAAPAHVHAYAATVAVVGAAAAVPARLLTQLPGALGVAGECVHWYEVGASVPDDADGYVVIGTEAARALGVQLSTMQQNSSVIAATAEPAELLRDGSAKRALWQSLKPLARRLRECV